MVQMHIMVKNREKLYGDLIRFELYKSIETGPADISVELINSIHKIVVR